MGDTPEMIRQQMQQTKSQLAEKMEAIGLHAAEFVESTRSTVNDTVIAVHDTVTTLNGAVQHVVQTVSHVLDVRRQVDRHPWYVFGGSIAFGYLAVRLLSGSKQQSLQNIEKPPAANLSAHHKNIGSPTPAAEATTTPGAIQAAYQSGRNDSTTRQLRDVAIGAFVGVVQDLASHAARSMVDYLGSNRAKAPSTPSNNHADQNNSSTAQESSEAIRRRIDATSKSAQSGKSF